jgi:hypothetical protein
MASDCWENGLIQSAANATEHSSGVLRNTGRWGLGPSLMPRSVAGLVFTIF